MASVTSSLGSVSARARISGDPSTPPEYLRSCQIFQQDGIWYRITYTFANQLQAYSKADWQHMEAEARDQVRTLKAAKGDFESATINLQTRDVEIVTQAGAKQTILHTSTASDDVPVLASVDKIKRIFDRRQVTSYPAIRITQASDPSQVTPSMTNPSGAPSGAPAARPRVIDGVGVGLPNADGSYCWINSLMQMIYTMPDLENAILQLPNEVPPRSPPGTAAGMHPVKAFLMHAKDKNTPLATLLQDMTTFRQWLAVRAPALENGNHDPIDALEEIVNALPAHVQRAFCPRINRTEQFRNALHLHSRNGLQAHAVAGEQIAIDLSVPATANQRLGNLIRDYFKDEDITLTPRSTAANPAPVPSPATRATRLQTPKDHLLVNVARVNLDNQHVEIPVIVPQTLTLSEAYSAIPGDANFPAHYELASFNVHVGGNEIVDPSNGQPIPGVTDPRTGHHIAYAKRGGQWYEFDDDMVRPVTVQEALMAARRAHLVHYKRIKAKVIPQQLPARPAVLPALAHPNYEWQIVPSRPGVTLRIVNGDILSQQSQAIVNPANETLMGGGGLDGIIHDAAERIRNRIATTPPRAGLLAAQCQLSPILETLADGTQVRCRTGDAVTTPSLAIADTSAGHIPYRTHIIHAVGPDYRKIATIADPAEQAQQVVFQRSQLYNAVYNSLKEAQRLGLTSVSIPGVSTGVFQFPEDEAAEITVRAIRDFQNDYPATTVTDIRLVYPDAAKFQTAQNAATRALGIYQLHSSTVV